MSKSERQATVESLAQQVKGSPNVFVTDFQGLNVARMTDLRRRLRAAGARYVVVKNTLAQRALEANGLPTLPESFKGQVGLVLAGGDPLPAAKVVGEFAKEFQKPTVKSGLLEGKTVHYHSFPFDQPVRNGPLDQSVGEAGTQLTPLLENSRRVRFVVQEPDGVKPARAGLRPCNEVPVPL